MFDQERSIRVAPILIGLVILVLIPLIVAGILSLANADQIAVGTIIVLREVYGALVVLFLAIIAYGIFSLENEKS